MKDYELEAAKRALKYAEDGVKKYEDKYKNLCKSFGSMIMSNGLAQAISFCEAKKDQHYKLLVENVKKEMNIFLEYKTKTEGSLSKNLLEMNIKDYMNFQRQLMITLKWLRRYVDIF